MTHFKTYILFAVLILCAVCDKKTPTENGDDPPQFENGIQLTNNISDINPRWQAQGTMIAFERGGHIYTITIDTASGAGKRAASTVTYLTEGRWPCWSYDGLMVYFVKDAELYLINIEARIPQKLTTAAQVSEVSGIDINRDERLAYFMPNDSSHENSRLVVYMVNWEYYRHYEEFTIGFAERPRWSFDKTTILFNSNLLGPSYITFDTEIWVQIMPSALPGKVCWQGNDKILFCTRGNLYSVDIDGQNQTALYDVGDFYPGSIDYCQNTFQVLFSYGGIWIMDIPNEPIPGTE